jgi:hypothetical protein
MLRFREWEDSAKRLNVLRERWACEVSQSKKAKQRQSPKRLFFLIAGILWRCRPYLCGKWTGKSLSRKETYTI